MADTKIDSSAFCSERMDKAGRRMKRDQSSLLPLMPATGAAIGKLTLTKRPATMGQPAPAGGLATGRHHSRPPLAANHHALVKRTIETKPTRPTTTRLALSLLVVLVAGAAMSLPNYRPSPISAAEAKVHHSKRQAPATQAAAVAPTGRESTNWWNLWWQRKFADQDSSDADEYLMNLASGSLAALASDEAPRRSVSSRPPQPVLQSPTPHLHSPPPSPPAPRARHQTPEYINEAQQPTVRPIVGVSFNGRSINLSAATAGDQQPNDLVGQQNNNVMQYHQGAGSGSADPDSANSVFGGAQQSVAPAGGDLERNERFAGPNQLLDGNTDVFVDKQMLLAHRKSMQHHVHWQSAKPTLIQPSTGAAMTRDGRTNRQVNELPGSGELGIQMRSARLNNVQQQQQQLGKQNVRSSETQVRARGPLASPAQNLMHHQQQRHMVQQQQVILEDQGKFEQQQQHQMVDYSEESEPELTPDDASQTGDGSSTDSSSSSMMQEEKSARAEPALIMPGMRKTTEPALGGRFDPNQAAGRMEDGGGSSSSSSSSRMQQGPRTLIMMGMGPQSVAPPGEGSPQQPDSTLPSSTAATMEETSSDTRSPPTIPGSTQQAMAPRTTMTTATSSATTQGSVTSAPAATTTTFGKPSSTTATNEAVDVNETPVTRAPGVFGMPNTPKVATMMTTTPGGRVQLENGRPATGFRQQATTNAARPPTVTTQPTTKSSAAAGEQTTKSMRPATTPSPQQVPTTTTQVATTGDGSTEKVSQVTTTSRAEAPSSEAATTTTTAPVTTTTLAPSSPSVAITTLRPMSMAKNETSPGKEKEKEEEDDDDDDDDDDDKDEKSSNSGDDDDDDDDNEADDEKTPGAANNSTGAASSSTTPAQQQTPSTTQQPSMTTIDIERLPKGGQQGATSTLSPSPAAESGMGDSSSAGSTTTTTTPAAATTTSATSEEFSRIQVRPGDANQQQQQPADNSANIVMMTIGQNRPSAADDDEMAITMPMEALMKMMSQMTQDNERLQLGGVPMTSIVAATETPMTTPNTTPQTTTTSASTSTSSRNQEASTERPTTTTTVASSTRLPASMVSMGEEENAAVEVDGSATRKKPGVPSPPPPTPRAGGQVKQQQQSLDMQTSFMEPLPMGTATTAAQADSGAMTTQATGQAMSTSDKSVVVGLEPMSVSPGDDMMPGEPKIELLNLDLMPIQRIMNNQMGMRQTGDGRAAQQRQQQQPDGDQQQQQQQQQQGPMSVLNGSTSARPGEFQTNQMEQVVIGEVEPGMRLRPPTGSSFMNQQQQQQQQPSWASTPIIMSSDMMNNKNQANTVYMIMMNTPAAEQVAQTKRPPPPTPTTTSSSSTRPTSQATSLAPTTKTSSMTTLFTQRDQTRPTTASLPTTKSAMQMDRLGQTTLGTPQGGQQSSQGLQMRVSPQAGTTPASTKSPLATTTMRQRQLMMIQMSAMSQQQPASSTTTTGRPSPSMENAEELEIQRQTDQRQTTKSTDQVDQRGAAMTTRQQQQQASTGQTTDVPSTTTSAGSGRSTDATTTTSSPTVERVQTTTTKSSPIRISMAAQTDQPTSTTASNSQETATDKDVRRTSQQVSTQQPSDAASTTTGAGTSRAPDTVSGQQQFGTTLSAGAERNNNKLERLQAQPTPSGQDLGGRQRVQQQGGTKTSNLGKVGGSKSSSSFIPNKLRNEFNKGRPEVDSRAQPQAAGSSKQSQFATEQSATTQVPLTGMAIRQFGGANRMSVLGNQPVPFGRPAAMTMQSAARASAPSRGGPEVPTFEYGPSIAVRRPDEPLANGQIPNCTLTGKNFCVLTKDYPMNEVRQAVERSFRSVRIMYEELQTVSDQELHKDDYANATNNQAASGKFACQTQVEMMRPGWAKDEITKEWMLVVNTDVFPQRVRTESCAQPNTPCEFIAPFYDSTCQQRYSLHRMIAIDPHDPSRSPQVAVFRFPAGCVCRVHPIRKTTTASAMSAITTQAPTTSSISGNSTGRR